MDIKTASFVTSNTDYKKCPSHKLPEYAFIGRSNVGKSSLINMLTNNKKLAKTSSRPGKTQLINHFIIDDTWYLVDLPGYGYAQVSKKNRTQWQKFIRDYILLREELISLFVLLDSRHTPQKIDIEFISWLGEKGIPFSIIFTKADKLKEQELLSNIQAYRDTLSKMWSELPEIFISSSEKQTGKDDILGYIDEINGSL